MHYFDHNYDRLMARFYLVSIKGLFMYYNLTVAYKIVCDLLYCSDLRSLFTARDIPYPIRNRRPIQDETHQTTYDFYSPIARPRRAWNSLPQSIHDATCISSFKRLLRNVILYINLVLRLFLFFFFFFYDFNRASHSLCVRYLHRLYLYCIWASNPCK